MTTVTESKPVCQWLLPNNHQCLRVAIGSTKNGTFCFSHLPLAKAGYDRKQKPKPRPKHDPVDEMRRKWRAELDSEWESHKEKIESRKPIKRRRPYEPSDFPRYVDGIYFEHIDDFYTFYAGESFDEMAGTDQEYLLDEVLPPHPKGHQRILFPQYSRDSFDYGHNYSGYNSSRAISYEKPRIKLKQGEWRRIESIAHMRYCIIRAQDGYYYAVWVSLNEAGHLKEVMTFVSTQTLPQSVTECTWGRYHTSKGYKHYEDARDKLSSAGETFWRIKERMKKAEDPNWIPPNLRKLALLKQWEDIPLKWHDRLHKWVADGAPGWWNKSDILKLIDTAKGKKRLQ